MKKILIFSLLILCNNCKDVNHKKTPNNSTKDVIQDTADSSRMKVQIDNSIFDDQILGQYLKDNVDTILNYERYGKLDTNIANAYCIRGVVKMLNKKDLKGAIEDFDKYIKLNPHDAKAYFWRGNSKVQLNDLLDRPLKYQYHLGKDDRNLIDVDNTPYLKESIRDFKKAVKLKPDYVLAYVLLADAKNTLEDFKGSKEDYSKIIQIKPQSSHAYVGRGTANFSLSNNHEAVRDFSAAIKLDSNYLNAYRLRGIAYSALNQTKKAIEDFSKFISLDSTDADGFYNRGDAKFKLKDFKGAVDDYKIALKLNSKIRVNESSLFVFNGLLTGKTNTDTMDAAKLVYVSEGEDIEDAKDYICSKKKKYSDRDIKELTGLTFEKISELRKNLKPYIKTRNKSVIN